MARAIAEVYAGVMLLGEDNAPGQSSLLSNVPAWALEALIVGLVGLVLAAIFSPALWRLIRKRVRPKPPVQLYIETDARKMFANQPYDWISFAQFVPRPIEETPDPPEGFATNMGEWARQLDGLPAWHCNYALTITADSERSVVVSGLRIEAEGRPLPDGCVLIKGVGGASMEFRRLQVNLNSEHCTAEFVAMGGSPSEPFEFQLRKGESARFNLMVSANSDEEIDMYVWWGYLDLVVDGKPYSLRVGPSERDIKKGKAPDYCLVNRNRRPEFMGFPGADPAWSPF